MSQLGFELDIQLSDSLAFTSLGAGSTHRNALPRPVYSVPEAQGFPDARQALYVITEKKKKIFIVLTGTLSK